MKTNTRLVLFTLILVAIQTVCKYLFADKIEWSGFSPFIAIALFSGFIVKEKNMSFLLPLLALVISDVIIQMLYVNGLFTFAGFYSGMWKNYVLLLAIVSIGWMLKGRSYGSVLVGAVAAPVLYFLISNFLVWAEGTMYPKTFSGLMTCYEYALPFFRNSLIATLIFVPMIIAAYNTLTKSKTAFRLA
ncbi:MAG: hypothetical protein JST23_09945 [Bacteroidetes bacterium]|nr:hypothetical protein [Bacteroidota bacterium]